MNKIEIIYSVDATQYSKNELELIVDALNKEIEASATSLWPRCEFSLLIIASKINNLLLICEDGYSLDEDKVAKLREDIEMLLEDLV